MVAAGPSPGRMPTTVPRKQPTKHQNRLRGLQRDRKSVQEAAERRPCSESEHAGRQRDAQREREDQIEPERAPAPRSRRRSAPDGRNTTVTMKNVSSAKLSRNPSGSISATDSAKASQVLSARQAVRQSGRRSHHRPCESVLTISTSESAIIADAVPGRKEAGPGAVEGVVVPLARLQDDVDAERRQHRARDRLAVSQNGLAHHANPPPPDRERSIRL